MLGMAIYFGYQFTHETTVTPCSPGGYPIRCYQASQKMCDTIWAKAEVACKEFVKKLSLPPGRLTGPIVFRCQSVALDNAFSVSRKSTSECGELFQALDDWKKRNSFDLRIEQ